MTTTASEAVEPATPPRPAAETASPHFTYKPALDGLRAIAVPMRNKRGDVVAAMNAAGSNRALELSYLKETVLPAMYEAANRIRVNLPS